MKVARAYRLAVSVVLAWAASDVLVAAWSIGRHATSQDYRAHTLTLYGANLTAVAFHEPSKLGESSRSLEGMAPAWEQSETPETSGSFDDFAAMAARMGAV